MGYDTLEEYFDNDSFFGAVIAPNANRIAGARFSIDGVEYQLDANDGPNNLHSHKELGSHKRVWDAAEGDNSITFSLSMADGELGFPGNKKLQVTYTLTEDNELKLEYAGISDKKTILNMTNHSYFNLDGHDAGDIGGHVLTLHADTYTEILPGAIPTGKLVPVEGTPMDFRAPKKIGKEIDTDWDQLTMVGGYDHNWCLNGYDGSVRLVACTQNPSGSRTMEVCTDLPGVQFYAANGLTDRAERTEPDTAAEAPSVWRPQYYPDTANEPDFPSAVFGPDREYRSTTIFRFV